MAALSRNHRASTDSTRAEAQMSKAAGPKPSLTNSRGDLRCMRRVQWTASMPKGSRNAPKNPPQCHCWIVSWKARRMRNMRGSPCLVNKRTCCQCVQLESEMALTSIMLAEPTGRTPLGFFYSSPPPVSLRSFLLCFCRYNVCFDPKESCSTLAKVSITIGGVKAPCWYLPK